ncbi:MAG: MBL fold metallo-hydrolase [Deltaproteobacteria bacterium]|nr:MBL fold metallo-hydrolase [Deltaproteobacteria bacterium]
MNIGPWEVGWVDLGTFRLDGGAMFGVVPRPIWSGLCPPDDQNRIHMGLWGLLLRSPGRCILVDSGVWAGFGDKLRSIYAVEPGQEQRGTVPSPDPGEVTDLVLTHLHFDHAGGAVLPTEDGPRLTFPRATYHVCRTQLDWALHPSPRDMASYAAEMVLTIRENPRLNSWEGTLDLGDGVTLHAVGGHTPGMALLLVQDGPAGMLHLADLVPTSLHVPLPYVMGYDLDPVETVRLRQRWYAEAAYKDWWLFFQHDPEHPLWTIRRDEKGRYVRDRRIEA